MVASDVLVVFNPRSGGARGQRVLAALRDRLPEARWLRLEHGCDLAGAVSSGVGRVIAAGGDGTASAVLEAVHRLGAVIKPLVAILPLGTGNDLARSLGHAGGLHDAASLEAWWRDFGAGVMGSLDRWLLIMPGGGVQAWYCYCSWGGDARTSYVFHRWRHTLGRLVRSRLLNRVFYVAIGACSPARPSALRVRGRRGLIPVRGATLVATNIPTYAGGRSLGPGIAVGDGRCDLRVLSGGLRLGLQLAGVSALGRLGSAAGSIVELTTASFVQLDGEPRRAPPGVYRIGHGGQVQVLCPRGSLPPLVGGA